jgi:asparagine synthase (glutamine-hydrolysing)
MCGIIAYSGNKFLRGDLDKALHLMNHRGPDNQSSTVLNNDIFLGHNRLSIIDLDSRSNQPFTSGNHVMVFNGEVYNYLELIKDHNLNVRTKSDTEVVLEMFKKYGEKCLGFFNGMFALVIYDTQSKEIFVARDRLGIKPLYFSRDSSGILFASEIASIQSLVQSEFDDFGMRQYRKLRMTVKGDTIYSKIKSFPPGHYLMNGKFQKYWDLDYGEKKAPSDEQLDQLIRDSVELRNRSDVRVGSYLSGGLDSTILSTILRPDHTWTVGFSELNEFNWATMANETLKSKHHQMIVNKSDFVDTARRMINKRMEPLSVPNEVLIYLMTKEVKKKNTVVLSGEGADELFWGYDRIFRWARDAKSLDVREFDSKYCYGSHTDDEVLDYALEGLQGNSPLEKLGYYFQVHHLQGLLRRLDNSTMLCSVEARVPFVDHRLVELLAGVPYDWKMGNSFKEPLKRIYKNLIPNGIIERKKIGFPVPLESIFSENINANNTPMDSWLNFNINHLIKKS